VADFFEIDFIDVESPKSGDAIALRYQQAGQTAIHVVDAGYQDTGPAVVTHIKTYYNNSTYVNHVVATHSDGDHAGGLRTVLESFAVGCLWMHRPWLIAEQLLPMFPSYSSAERLATRLKDAYSNLTALEEIALRKGIPIGAPIQGTKIGAFTVMAPSIDRYVRCLLDSERTPESTSSEAQEGLGNVLLEALAKVRKLVKGAWGQEVFSPNETSAENEMSVVQFAVLCAKKVLLTGDAGRGALTEVVQFAPQIQVALPGLDRFQVPHHGSRRNVSTETLDQLLGPRVAKGTTSTFEAVCSAAKMDADHPRNSVKRAIIHRGGDWFDTKEGKTICSRGGDAPARANWVTLTPHSYPEDQEED
jgi:beta-lactamase superfamily II metal-dependent hydrolase